MNYYLPVSGSHTLYLRKSGRGRMPPPPPPERERERERERKRQRERGGGKNLYFLHAMWAIHWSSCWSNSKSLTVSVSNLIKSVFMAVLLCYIPYAEGLCSGLSNITMYLDQLLPYSGYVVCPGIKKNLVEWGAPFNQKFSSSCSRSHIPKNSRQEVDSCSYNCCKHCKKLLHDIQQLVRRSEQTTEVQKLARTLPTCSSKYPLSKLSPASQKKWVTKVIKERKNLVQK